MALLDTAVPKGLRGSAALSDGGLELRGAARWGGPLLAGWSRTAPPPPPPPPLLVVGGEELRGEVPRAHRLRGNLPGVPPAEARVQDPTASHGVDEARGVPDEHQPV